MAYETPIHADHVDCVDYLVLERAWINNLTIWFSVKIHDDSAQSSDRLNRLLYAKAIAQEIENIQPPMTIGILAKWGSGKTQLLMQIKGWMYNTYKQVSALYKQLLYLSFVFK